MSDPVVTPHVVAASALSAGSMYAIGASPAALILALCGAVAACVWHSEFDQPRKVYGAIMLATLLGGYGAPAGLAALNHALKSRGWDIPLEALDAFVPLVIGAGFPIVGPWLKNKYLGDKKGSE